MVLVVAYARGIRAQRLFRSCLSAHCGQVRLLPRRLSRRTFRVLLRGLHSARTAILVRVRCGEGRLAWLRSRLKGALLLQHR